MNNNLIKNENKINKAFLNSENSKAFIAFVTGGDPDLETCKKLILELDKYADLIEIGVPFSDPVAEGPVIQAADERALKAGCTTDKLFDLVKSLKENENENNENNYVKSPLVFMTYLNPIYTYGKEKFLSNCKKCGISGVIVPDMPFEERGELLEICAKYDINLISMIAPTSAERIKAIAKEAQGFLYCVSSLGVTGIRNKISGDISGMINEAKSVNSEIKCAVGFGVSTPEQAKEISQVADGVIIGSAIVKIIAEHGNNCDVCVNKIGEYAKSIKDAIR